MRVLAIRMHPCATHHTECGALCAVHRHMRFDRIGHTAGAPAHATHAQAYLSAYDRIAHSRAAWRAPQRQSDAKAVAAGCPFHGALQQLRRRGCTLRALLAADGRARRYALLIHEEQVARAHGGVSARPHEARVHVRWSVMCHTRGGNEVRARDRWANGGTGGGGARRKFALRTRIEWTAAALVGGCHSNISGSYS